MGTSVKTGLVMATHLLLLLASVVTLSLTGGSTPKCCISKTVGGVDYILKKVGDTTRYNCKSNCIYRKKGQPGRRFCFAAGKLEVLCKDPTDQVNIRGEIKTCVEEGNDFNQCLTQMVENIKSSSKTGIPDLGIPMIDPLYLESIEIDLNNESVDITLDLSENYVTGGSQLELIYIKVDKAQKTVSSKLRAPNFVATGKYVLTGTVEGMEVAEVPAESYSAEFTNFTLNFTSFEYHREENGEVIIDDDPDVTIDADGLNIKLENLFGGVDDNLAETMDQFLNQNMNKFLEVFQTQIAEFVTSFRKGFYDIDMKNIVQTAFDSK